MTHVPGGWLQLCRQNLFSNEQSKCFWEQIMRKCNLVHQHQKWEIPQLCLVLITDQCVLSELSAQQSAWSCFENTQTHSVSLAYSHSEVTPDWSSDKPIPRTERALALGAICVPDKNWRLFSIRNYLFGLNFLETGQKLTWLSETVTANWVKQLNLPDSTKNQKHISFFAANSSFVWWQGLYLAKTANVLPVFFQLQCRNVVAITLVRKTTIDLWGWNLKEESSSWEKFMEWQGLPLKQSFFTDDKAFCISTKGSLFKHVNNKKPILLLDKKYSGWPKEITEIELSKKYSQDFLQERW